MFNIILSFHLYNEFTIYTSVYSNWIKELYRELFHFRQYEKEVRPVLDPNERTVVDFQFSFTRIVVNEKEGTLETNGWLGLVGQLFPLHPRGSQLFLGFTRFWNQLESIYMEPYG